MSNNGENTISTENFVAFYLGKRLHNDKFVQDLELCIGYVSGDSGPKLRKLLESSSPEITQKLQEYQKSLTLDDILYQGTSKIKEIFGETVDIKVLEQKNGQ